MPLPQGQPRPRQTHPDKPITRWELISTALADLTPPEFALEPLLDRMERTQ